MSDLKSILDKIQFPSWKDLFYKYKEYMKFFENGKYFKEVFFASNEGEINAFIIRCNEVGVMNDQIRNNDWLIITVTESQFDGEIIKFTGTADPKSRIRNIASLLPQQYYGNIRNHHWNPTRPAICQDNDSVWVSRYNGKEEYGRFTIHIHNSAWLFNTSLGCFIIAREERYQELLKPLLNKVKKFQKFIPVTVIQEEVFRELIK